jgi:hypothetical protein
MFGDLMELSDLLVQRHGFEGGHIYLHPYTYTYDDMDACMNVYIYIYVVCVVTSLHHFAYQWFNLSKLRHHGHHVEQVTRAEVSSY